jgi:F-type H+-transporting ATPase subunit c
MTEANAILAGLSGLAIGITGLGAALAQGRAVAAAIDGTARNPQAKGVRGTLILGLGMIDSLIVMVAVLLMMTR